MQHLSRKTTSGVSSTTDVRRAVTATDPTAKHRRPAMTRRQTPASAHKLGRSARERERDRDGLDSWHDDQRESFPQFCMTCEKQFMPHDDRFLYCSETCRHIDQSSTPRNAVSTSSVSGGYGLHESGYLAEPRDIVPRATPSRPTSMHLSNSPPASPGSQYQHGHYSSAISALRSLNIGPSSPPSPTGSGIWPFGRSPSKSYSRPLLSTSSSSLAALDQHHQGRRHSSIYNYGNYDPAGYGGGLDRPLPSRHPSAYSRPKSIELVTPVIGR